MIGVVAAVAATVGDLLLLATSNATRPGFAWLPAPSATVLLIGTYLGVLAIPCYGVGYRAIAARFAEPYRRWIGALGIAGGVLGGTTHGLTGLAIHVEQTSGAGGVDPFTVVARYGAYLLPLWATVAGASLVGSTLYVVGILARRSALPRWTALANPAVLTLALVLVGAASPGGRAFLVPAAPNVAHVVFFALLTAPRVRAASRRTA
jgi:hypothetical protein